MFSIDEDGAPGRNSQKSLRERNLKEVFNLIHRAGRITRAELVRRSGLSPSTVSSLVGELVRAETVQELGLARPVPTSGRRPILLSIRADGRQIPVFSLREHGICYTLYDLCDGVLDYVFRPCMPGSADGTLFRDAGSSYAAIIAEILEQQSPSYRQDRAAALLISYPGIYMEAEHRFLLTATNTSFQMEVLTALERRLGLPVFIGNSSASLAYAEKKRLEKDGGASEDLIYVNVCGGVGAGIILGDDVLTHRGRMAGEIGHMTIQLDGRPCPCGSRGCLERYVNRNAILEEVRQEVARDTSGTHSEILRELLSDTTLERIGSAYALGIPPVRDAVNRVARWLSAGIYSAVNVTGIRRVVLGGLEALGTPFLETLRRLVSDNSARFLMRSVTIAHAHIRPEDEALGIAQYFVDKVFTIAADSAPRNPSEHDMKEEKT